MKQSASKQKAVSTPTKLTIAFYIEIGVAILSLIAAIAYKVGLVSLESIMTDIPLYAILIGIAGFALLSVVGQPKAGAGVLAVADWVAFLTFVNAVYVYPMEQIMVTPNILEIELFPLIVFCAAAMLLSAIVSNVMAWIPLFKKRRAK